MENHRWTLIRTDIFRSSGRALSRIGFETWVVMNAVLWEGRSLFDRTETALRDTRNWVEEYGD